MLYFDFLDFFQVREKFLKWLFLSNALIENICQFVKALDTCTEAFYDLFLLFFYVILEIRLLLCPEFFKFAFFVAWIGYLVYGGILCLWSI